MSSQPASDGPVRHGDTFRARSPDPLHVSQKEHSSNSKLGMWRGFLVAFGYGFVSLVITFFNKAVFAVYQFNYSNTLTLAQMVFSLAFLHLLRSRSIIKLAPLNLSVARKVFPLSLTFIGMVVTGLAALEYVNVPMYSALRRLTTWIVIVGEQFWLRKSYPFDEQLSVYGTVFGAVFASWGDLGFDFWGYSLTFMNCIVTAAYLLYIPTTKEKTHLDSFGLMYYNNILSVPWVVCLVVIFELRGLASFPLWLNPGFLMCFTASAGLAFALNYLIFLCSIVNSPLTTSITGQIKNVAQTLFGLFAFGDVRPTSIFLLGLIVSTLASVWYGQIKYMQGVRERLKAANKASPV